MAEPYRPNRGEILAATDKTVPDVIGPGLRLLFCGINPGLYSAAVGHHFARPGNRFWPVLYAAGFTDRLLSPFEDQTLLAYGYGVTNVVGRATASAGELKAEEFVQGGRELADRVRQYRPRMVAVLGIVAYRTAFGHPEAALGPQPVAIGGAATWVLPNPSGLNAHYRLEQLVELFHNLREAAAAAET